VSAVSGHDPKGGTVPNPAPPQARMAKRRVRKPGDLRALQRMLWQALIEAERVLIEAQEPELSLKAVHAVSQPAYFRTS